MSTLEFRNSTNPCIHNWSIRPSAACHHGSKLQYSHLIPTPVDLTFVSARLYKQPWIKYQKEKPSSIMNDPRCFWIKATFSWEVIDAQETGWQSGVQSCIMPRLPTHLVQDLNVGTVNYTASNSKQLYLTLKWCHWYNHIFRKWLK